MIDDPATQSEPSATILVVDDDHEIRWGLADSLAGRGYRVLTASNTREMDRLLARERVNVIILDVMMPGEDGLSACRRLARDGGPPIVLLSALGEEHDRVTGLEVGAGHYLPKPCSTREVIATVRAALRVMELDVAGAAKGYVFNGWRMDIGAHELLDPDGALVCLTDGEFALLRVLVERPRRVLSREHMLEVARGPDSEAFDRAVDVQISRLRRKLRSTGDDMIRTIRNEGYLFVPTVQRA